MRNFRIGRVDNRIFFFFFFKKSLQISSIVKFLYIAREYIRYFFSNEHDMGR